MFGIGFLVSENGTWGCSDEVMFDLERNLDFDGDKKTLSETKTLKFLNIFEHNDAITKGLKVHCLFKSNDKKMGFSGVVRGKTGETTIVEINSKIEDINIINAIVKKIKGGK